MSSGWEADTVVPGETTGMDAEEGLHRGVGFADAFDGVEVAADQGAVHHHVGTADLHKAAAMEVAKNAKVEHLTEDWGPTGCGSGGSRGWKDARSCRQVGSVGEPDVTALDGGVGDGGLVDVDSDILALDEGLLDEEVDEGIPVGAGVGEAAWGDPAVVACDALKSNVGEVAGEVPDDLGEEASGLGHLVDGGSESLKGLAGVDGLPGDDVTE